MGGPGSGSHFHWWRPTKKISVEECLTIDAGRWAREGGLVAGAVCRFVTAWSYASGNSFCVNCEAHTVDTEAAHVRLWYSWRWGDGPLRSEDYAVGLETTRPHFGGLRWWFLCPVLCRGRPCGRRVAKLHLPPHGRYFGCRRCHDLTYTSSQESHQGDALLRRVAGGLGMDIRAARRALRNPRKRRW